MQFPNGGIRPLSGIPRKVKSKNRAAVSLTCLLQDDGDNEKSIMVPGTPINQWRLGFKDDEISDTGNCTGGYVVGSTNAAKYYGKSGTPHL